MIQEVRERPLLMRELLGESLRELRTSSNLTLREVSGKARVSLGYLSEIERGQKEASSELLNAICGALDVPLSNVLRQVSDKIDDHAGVTPLLVRGPHIAAACPDARGGPEGEAGVPPRRELLTDVVGHGRARGTRAPHGERGAGRWDSVQEGLAGRVGCPRTAPRGPVTARLC